MTQTIHMKDLYAPFQELKNSEIIVDVRGPDEYADGHVPGSINIPFDEVGEHVETLRKYSRLYLYCRSGGRVQKAAADLIHLGFKDLVCVANSGMGDWISAGFEVER